ncbi:MAG: TadE/TadG family type IV pilus assembly protein [Terracidiphilus sp.]|jgi:Flp pilus assembly protein TadG
MENPNGLIGQTRARLHALKRGAASCRICRRVWSGVHLFRVSNDGQATIEMALAAPILILLMTGIFSLGFAFLNYSQLIVAVDAGAQYVSVEGNVTGGSTSNLADPCQATFTQITNSAPTLNPANITVTYILTNGTTSTPVGPFTGVTANTCASDSALFGAGGQVTVQATYPVTIGFYGASMTASTLTATSGSRFIYTN